MSAARALQVAAAQLHHPLLAPVPLNLRSGIGPDQAAILAVILSPKLKPLAIAIISGLAFQLPLVLIVLPCLLALFGHRASGRPKVTQAALEPVAIDR
jgi:hypothetical protein